ncbi:MAG: TadE/TadG family type IV pilus assembly protein [Bdellovibrionota bacterium]
MLEAAIALPVFFLLVFFIFSLSDVTTKYCAVFTALNRAAHAFQSISAMQGVTEEQALQIAGNTFLDQVRALGISTEDLSYDPTYSPAYILVGSRATINGRCSDAAPAV